MQLGNQKASTSTSKVPVRINKTPACYVYIFDIVQYITTIPALTPNGKTLTKFKKAEQTVLYSIVTCKIHFDYFDKTSDTKWKLSGRYRTYYRPTEGATRIFIITQSFQDSESRRKEICNFMAISCCFKFQKPSRLAHGQIDHPPVAQHNVMSVTRCIDKRFLRGLSHEN